MTAARTRVARPWRRFARKIAPTGGGQSRVIRRGVRFVAFVVLENFTYAFTLRLLVVRELWPLRSSLVVRVDSSSRFEPDDSDVLVRMYLPRVTRA